MSDRVKKNDVGYLSENRVNSLLMFTVFFQKILSHHVDLGWQFQMVSAHSSTWTVCSRALALVERVRMDNFFYQ